MKIDREVVHAKYDGHCAYCGCEITVKQMQVDHIIPKRQYSETHGCLIVNCQKFTEYGLDDIRNLNPACRVCNNWKLTHSIEQFRHEISMQVERVRAKTAGFRMSEKYGLVQEIKQPVIFYFERVV